MSLRLGSLLAAALAFVGTGNPLHTFLEAVAGAVPDSGIPSGFSGVLYVAKNGSNTTGARNTLNPFLTIQAAVDAAQDGDIVIVQPGRYVENVVVPAARGNLTIQGSGRYVTEIMPAAGIGLLWNPTGLNSTLNVRGLTILSAGTKGISSNPAGAAAFSGTLAVQDCFLSGTSDGFELLSGGAAVLTNCMVANGTRLVDCASARIEDCRLANVEATVASPLAAGLVHTGYVLRDTTLSGTLTQSALAIVDADTAVNVATYTGSIDTNLANSGALTFQGRAATFTLNLPGETIPVNLRGARLGVVTVDLVNAASPDTIDARGASVDNLTLASTGAQALVFDVRGGSIGIVTAAPANTFIDRDGDSTSDVNIASGDVVHTYDAGILAGIESWGGDVVGVVFQPAAQPAAFNEIVAIDTYTVSGFRTRNASAGAITGRLIFKRKTDLF